MRSWLALVCIWFGLVSPRLAVAEPSANLENGVMLHGYDPVSYFKKDKPVKGNASISGQKDGLTYWFADDASRKEFLREPAKYVPEYEGWCATAVAKGYKYDIDPESYKITGGRLFLFYKGWKGDAKDQWLEDEPKNTKLADKNWPTVRKEKP